MHIHILGICGTFMGGLAALAREAGHVVTGCDAGVYPPMSDQLRALGIELIEGYGAEQLALAPDMFVVGNVVSRAALADGSPKFPLMEAILNAGAPYTSGPQWLAETILQGRRVLAVAGTHGKTTTSSMLTWILEEAGLAPGFLIGGVPSNFEVSARLGLQNAEQGKACFVIEADEYDCAFFDKRSKFVHYRPWVAVLNNLEFDHADIFPDLAAIQRQFHHFLRTVPSAGHVISNAEVDSLEEVLSQGCWSRVHRFGDQSDFTFTGTPSSFQVFQRGRGQGAVNWALTGRHNQMNALAAIAAASCVGVSVEQSCHALSAFQSVKRRMEVKGVVGEITVYDDFAHHPSAILTTLQGLRQEKTIGRIFAIFEPRSNTMKLGTMKAMLPQALSPADMVFCYTGGLDWDAASALDPLGDRVICQSDIDALVQAVVDRVRPGDQLVCMSNGSFQGVHQRLLDALSAARNVVEKSLKNR